MRMVPNAQKIAKRFIQPRPDCFNDGNVVGTYYHLFALGIVDMLSVGTLSHTSAVAEAIAQSLTSELKLDWVYFELNL